MLLPARFPGALCCEFGTCSSVKVPDYAGLWGVQKKPKSLLGLITCPHTGVKIIFRVGLVLLKHALGSPEKLKACQGQYETIEQLRSLSPKIMQEAFLVQEVRTYVSHLLGREGELAVDFGRSLIWPCPKGWLVRVEGPHPFARRGGSGTEALCSVFLS